MRDYSKGEMLIMVGMTAMVEEEGLTPHEAMAKTEKLKNDMFFALTDIKKEVDAKRRVAE